MVIDDDVRVVAKHWGLDAALVQAVVTAEGNILKAVQCSVPSVQTRAQALEVLCRSCTHALVDYASQSNPDGFVQFWQQRWAPTGVSNDPTNLNANWATNVESLWRKGRQA